LESGTYAQCPGVSCPPGPAGPQGTNGTDGIDGTAGPQGPNGTVGPTGPAGPQGPNGTTGLPGTDGLNGTNGYNGGITVIPFSGEAALVSIIPASLGFGSLSAAITIPVVNIDVYINGWVAPRAGTIVALSSSLAVTAELAIALGSSGDLTVTVYTSPAGSGGNPSWAATSVSSTISLGGGLSLNIGDGIAGTNVAASLAVNQGDKIALVLTSSSLLSAVTGIVGAGLAFSS